jgi:hypothetical protein
MIISLVFDLGIANLPVIFVNSEHPIVRDTIPSKALVVVEQIVELGRILQ